MRVSLVTLLALTLFFSFSAFRAGNAAEVTSSDDVLHKESAQLLQEQKERIDLLEAALRAVSLALIKQNNNKVFASIVGDLKKDSHVSSLLASATVAKATSPKSKPPSNKETADITTAYQNYTNTAISKVKLALKCSQPELFDINSIDKPGTIGSSINATLNQSDRSILVSWKPSAECTKHLSNLWVRIFQAGDVTAASIAHYLTVPPSCLKKNSDKALSFVLHTKNVTANNCHAYTVEVVPNYQSFKGKALQSEVVVPPSLINETNVDVITRVHFRIGSLELDWLINSGCSEKLEHILIKFFEDGDIENNRNVSTTLRVPRKCFGQPSAKNTPNIFSLILPNDRHGCNITSWEPLDSCRKYTIEVKFQYFSDWTGPPALETFFTSRGGKKVEFAPHFPRNMWQCGDVSHYYCSNRYGSGDCRYNDNFCGDDFCSDMQKEKICSQMACSNAPANVHHCSPLCMPHENLCDARIDCLDGSDEDNCDYCYELTGTGGQLTSQIDYNSLGYINSERSTFAGFTNVLITAPANQTIWLLFTKFSTSHIVKVYDGPFSTYPLLGLFDAGSSLPPSVRSSSNSLYLRYPRYYSNSLGIEVNYRSVKNQGKPFRLGCDGYVNGQGVVRFVVSNHTAWQELLTDCAWFIEARNEQQTLLLKTSRKGSKTMTHSTADINALVFSDWNRSKKLDLMENWTSKSSQSAVLYSPGNKLLMEIPTSTVFSRFLLSEITNFSIQVFSLSPASCSFELTGSSGTIKSPLYPNAYPHLSDCRWKIVTPTGTKIRLLFALFETQEKTDYVFVYDGATLDSPVLLEGSGTLSTPFLVNSSTNELLVRFVSDDEVALSGFLAVFNAE